MAGANGAPGRGTLPRAQRAPAPAGLDSLGRRAGMGRPGRAGARAGGSGGMSEEQQTTIEPNGWEWMLVEIMGHRTHWGRVREEERFGSKMMRVDVPLKGDPDTHGWGTFYYSGAAIFSYTLTDE